MNDPRIVDAVFTAIREATPDEIELSWETPRAKKDTSARRIPMATIAALLRLVPGEWLKVGPVISGSYHAWARKEGMEATSRRENSSPYMYFRYPPKDGAS